MVTQMQSQGKLAEANRYRFVGTNEVCSQMPEVDGGFSVQYFHLNQIK